MPERRSHSQRQFLGTLIALIKGSDVPADEGTRAVANYIRKNRDKAASAFLILITMSPNDPLPVHCFLTTRDGVRLADSNRVCQIRDRVYSWPSRFEGQWYEGAIMGRLLVCNLISAYDNIEREVVLFRRRAWDN